MEQEANAQRQQTVRIDINYLVINQQINKDNFPALDDIPIEPAPLKNFKAIWKIRISKIFKTSEKYNLLDKAGYWCLTIQGDC